MAILIKAIFISTPESLNILLSMKIKRVQNRAINKLIIVNKNRPRNYSKKKRKRSSDRRIYDQISRNKEAISLDGGKI